MAMAEPLGNGREPRAGGRHRARRDRAPRPRRRRHPEVLPPPRRRGLRAAGRRGDRPALRDHHGPPAAQGHDPRLQLAAGAPGGRDRRAGGRAAPRPDVDRGHRQPARAPHRHRPAALPVGDDDGARRGTARSSRPNAGSGCSCSATARSWRSPGARSSLSTARTASPAPSCRSGARSGCSTSTRCSATSRPIWSSRSVAPTPARRPSCGRRTPPTLPCRCPTCPARPRSTTNVAEFATQIRRSIEFSGGAAEDYFTLAGRAVQIGRSVPAGVQEAIRSLAAESGPNHRASGPAAHRGAGGAVGARLPQPRADHPVGRLVAVPGRPRGGLAVAARRAQAAPPPAADGRRTDGGGPDRRLHRRPRLEEPGERRRGGRRGRGPLHAARADGRAGAGHGDRPVRQPARVRRPARRPARQVRRPRRPGGHRAAEEEPGGRRGRAVPHPDDARGRQPAARALRLPQRLPGRQ